MDPSGTSVGAIPHYRAVRFSRAILAVWSFALLVLTWIAWANALAYVREHDPVSDAQQMTFLAVGAVALMLAGIGGALALSRGDSTTNRVCALLVAGGIAVYIGTSFPFQSQAEYAPGCVEYTGTEPAPDGEPFECGEGYAFGAALVTAAEVVPLMAGVGLVILGETVRDRRRVRANPRRIAVSVPGLQIIEDDTDRTVTINGIVVRGWLLGQRCPTCRHVVIYDEHRSTPFCAVCSPWRPNQSSPTERTE